MTQLGLLDWAPPPTAPYAPGSDTSRAAAKAIRGHLTTLEQRVLDAIRAAGDAGLTDEECMRVTGLRPNTQRPRRIELLAAKLVRDSGQRRPGVSGRKMTVWIATGER
jgi:hypothetical protein